MWHHWLDPWRQWLRDAPALPPNRQETRHVQNRLLASLPSDVYSALTPHVKIVELKFGDVVAEAGSEIRQVYFPYSGVISLVVELKVGAIIETAMVGRDGVVNAAPALDGKVSLNKGIGRQRGRHEDRPTAPADR